jgi:hypothetical protein
MFIESGGLPPGGLPPTGQSSCISCAPPRREHRYDVVSKSNKFRKPVSLARTPWDDEHNVIDHHASPSNLKTAVA